MQTKPNAYKTITIERGNNKYHSKKTTIDGIVFDSIREGERYCELKMLLKAGQIKNLQWQVPFILFEKNRYGRKLVYRADFVYEQNGEIIVEDVKSKATKTQIYKLKKRIVAEKYGIEIKEIY